MELKLSHYPYIYINYWGMPEYHSEVYYDALDWQYSKHLGYEPDDSKLFARPGDRAAIYCNVNLVPNMVVARVEVVDNERVKFIFDI